MKKILLFIFIIFISHNSIFGQGTSIQNTGEILSEAIAINDTTLFKTLILPKERFIALMQTTSYPEISKDTLAELIKRVELNYEKLFVQNYVSQFKYQSLKVQKMGINMDSLQFNTVELSGLDTSITAIQADLRDNTFKYFSFYVMQNQGKWYLANSQISISDLNPFVIINSQNGFKFSSDKNDNLILKGIVVYDSLNPKEEILKCFSKFPLSMSVEKVSTKNKNSANISGKWTYSYYVDDNTVPIGSIEFSYEYTISNGWLEYHFYDFIHDKESYKLKSIGQLATEFNKKAEAVFTRKQYSEIMHDLELNMKNWIKILTKYSTKCLNTKE